MVDATAHSDAAPTGGPADSPERSAVGASPVGRPHPRIATRACVCISSRCRRCRRNKQLRHRSPMAEPLRLALLRRLLVFAEPATPKRTSAQRRICRNSTCMPSPPRRVSQDGRAASYVMLAGNLAGEYRCR